MEPKIGYTHYFEHTRKGADQNWFKTEILTDVARFLGFIQGKGIKLSIDKLDSEAIIFNGDLENDDLNHETFYYEFSSSTWAFCKTARKPYDVAVCGVLLILTAYWGDLFRVSSDGEWVEKPEWFDHELCGWDGAAKLVMECLGHPDRQVGEVYPDHFAPDWSHEPGEWVALREKL